MFNGREEWTGNGRWSSRLEARKKDRPKRKGKDRKQLRKHGEKQNIAIVPVEPIL